jgi:hypothetical protein
MTGGATAVASALPKPFLHADIPNDARLWLGIKLMMRHLRHSQIAQR